MVIASKINFKATTSTNTDNKTEFPPENEWKNKYMNEWMIGSHSSHRTATFSVIIWCWQIHIVVGFVVVVVCKKKKKKKKWHILQKCYSCNQTLTLTEMTQADTGPDHFPTITPPQSYREHNNFLLLLSGQCMGDLFGCLPAPLSFHALVP